MHVTRYEADDLNICTGETEFLGCWILEAICGYTNEELYSSLTVVYPVFSCHLLVAGTAVSLVFWSSTGSEVASIMINFHRLLPAILGDKRPRCPQLNPAKYYSRCILQPFPSQHRSPENVMQVRFRIVNEEVCEVSIKN